MYKQYIEVERAKADLRLTRSSLDSITRSPSRAPPSGAPSSRPPRTKPMAPACSPAKMSRRVATLTDTYFEKYSPPTASHADPFGATS